MGRIAASRFPIACGEVLVRNYSHKKTHVLLALVSKFAMANRFVKSPVTSFCPATLIPLIGPNWL